MSNNLLSQQPELYANINKSFTGQDGKIDKEARNAYLEKTVGNDALSGEDMDRLNARFPKDAQPVCKNRADFEAKLVPGFLNSTDGKNVKEMLDKYGDNPAILDSLSSQFSQGSADGKLDVKQAKGLDKYIEGACTQDSIEAKGTKHMNYDIGLLEERYKAKPQAVTDSINNDNIFKDLKMHSYNGDRVGGGKSSDAYLGGDYHD
ncbi:MAG: hypothetical protein V4754_10190 [Pseudomonadota bacterium]